MSADIERMARRTAAYWFADGFAEMGAGAVVAAIGLLFLVEAVVPGAPKGLSAYGLPVVVILGSWLAKRLVERAKEQQTYPRTGRVVYRRLSPGLRAVVMLLGAACGAAIAAGLVLLLRAHAGIVSWLPLLQGVSGAGLVLLLAKSAGQARLYAVALVSVAAGAILSVSGLAESMAAAIYFGAMGAALALSGLLAHRDYLRQAPPTEEA